MSTAVFTAIGVAVYVAGFGTLCRNSSRFHAELDKLYRRARDAQTDEELEDVAVAVHLFAAKECWHHSHSDRVREVLAYIDGRLNK